MAVLGKRFEYAIELARDRTMVADGEPLAPGPAWSADHLLLAALAECSVASLRYHAERAGITVEASASASGAVTKREEDGRYGFVEAEVSIDAELTPAPSEEALAELLMKAERDCFVGASLRVSPRYRWRVNATTQQAAAADAA